MPELPEVEVVRRGLDEHVRGLTFREIEVLHPRAVRDNDVDLTDVLPGLTIDTVRRRGKYLWFELSDGYALVIHLRMSGQMLVGKHGEVTSPHLRIRADLGDRELCFVDQRTFGYWHYASLDDEGLPTTMAHIAPDPFDASFDVIATARAMRSKNSAVKTVLLDQGIVSGIGSIYADEAMWAAGVKPTRKARGLRQKDAVRLLEESREVMARALAQGGTSFDSLYVNVNGASGYFSRSLNAYGQVDRPCARCGNPIKRTKVNGRSSYFCATCQVI
ncbi:bifunctional DNA-formamidopyrimidine glycosylase/DNA-(apurinic or apyrimidinic site) lyase [Corynebacterium cystitidis]|uniref:Formamidopyrimidine-DNA glycosylase n=1 Tax=Corynebacterium cystitidis DSM 20524 TaxID=1121357 RepID=A0A1H9NXN4_9CORY|nr:bifunctional DNA-formamidopyrimidine glycosylase/DNA-(apurinic or apyrimidinic site) lyase [Corynebacterium cystitidis]WJY82709.1 Formamidopyrimidine-DNA glycosylase 1 [Corynebacterium cystitidis DSM 20524]SER40093.1 DNA-(apurinic or apyrimidinic site) lyase [Corynebacterium cystitidis DSM 20524]SNV71527.1 Formamidopyrimidine-DNA glycosylase [Corynebacterium cystitidis]